ncbi:hypothetical protein Daus18300_011940 [Diaporthe australafricana]|uniref:Uncharacterized protein n=1 Tax=Diaporthe australafricana TaxID=127596 RepID=A0ABR3W4Z5_9PEZI
MLSLSLEHQAVTSPAQLGATGHLPRELARSLPSVSLPIYRACVCGYTWVQRQGMHQDAIAILPRNFPALPPPRTRDFSFPDEALALSLNVGTTWGITVAWQRTMSGTAAELWRIMCSVWWIATPVPPRHEYCYQIRRLGGGEDEQETAHELIISKQAVGPIVKVLLTVCGGLDRYKDWVARCDPLRGRFLGKPRQQHVGCKRLTGSIIANTRLDANIRGWNQRPAEEFFLQGLSVPSTTSFPRPLDRASTCDRNLPCCGERTAEHQFTRWLKWDNVRRPTGHEITATGCCTACMGDIDSLGPASAPRASSVLASATLICAKV